MKANQVTGALKESRETGKAKEISSSLGGKGAGSILFKAKPNGVGEWYFKVTSAGRKTRVKLGIYDKDKYKLIHASGDARLISVAHQRGECIKSFSRRQKAKQKSGSLCDLVNEYLESLKGRSSYHSAKSYLKKHVLGSHPKLCEQPARLITRDNIRDILEKAHKSGLTAGHNALLRYLKAVFNKTIKDADRPGAVDNYLIGVSPAAGIKQVSDWNRAQSTEPLTVQDMTNLFSTLENTEYMPLNQSRLIQFLLLTGQRPEQVLRAKWSDYDEKNKTLTIFNKKDKTRSEHVLPLTVRLCIILDSLQGYSSGAYIFGAAGRRNEPTNNLIIKHLNRHQRACDFRQTTIKLIRSSFTTGCYDCDFGEGVELVQAHSTGRSGSAITRKHYNRSQELLKKRQVLKAWDSVIQGEVTPIGVKAA